VITVQIAKQVFDIAIGEAEDTVSESKRNPPKRGRSRCLADCVGDGSEY